MKYFLMLLININFLFAQNTEKINMSAHVYFLSDDKLEGRSTGSKGEKLAANYIANIYKEYGLSPKGDNDYIQAFDFTLGKKLGELNDLMINGNKIELESGYFPLNYSGNGYIEAKAINMGFGIHAPGLYDDYTKKTAHQGSVFVVNLSSPDGIHPHSKYLNYTDYQTRIKTAEAFGAAAIIFYNTDKNLDDPEFDLSMKIKEFNIPVIFIKNQEVKDGDLINLNVDLVKQEKTGHNIIGYIDNQSPNTVIIGAHYDHLGWGKNGGSLYRGSAAIHNGADDNASGVALMLELAKKIKQSNLKQNNYLFIAFSGEELGLYGSKYFIQHTTVDTSKINYMLNFDMVGRLDEKNTMAVNGVGTSPLFKEKVTQVKTGNLNIKTTESGMGPSDHTSFYLANIPVLHFYTGNNPDYHKPTDDAYLINFEGMQQIFDYTITLLTDLDNKGKLVFTKTKDEDNRNAPKFKVTLGVVPDYMYDGEGMRIDGVTEGRPANNAGVLAGDVVKKIGNIEITDMMAYMTALSKFEKGEKTKLIVLRSNKLIELDLEF